MKAITKGLLIGIIFGLPFISFSQDVTNPNFGNFNNPKPPTTPPTTQQQTTTQTTTTATPVSQPAVVEQKAPIATLPTAVPTTSTSNTTSSNQSTSTSLSMARPKLTIKNKLNTLIWVVSAPSTETQNGVGDLGNAFSLQPNDEATVDTPSDTFSTQVSINDTNSTEVDCQDLPGNRSYVITIENNTANQPICSVANKI
ncbi:MAG: hypothetical protein A3E87_03785 [Gammaproteobacteria bacterium RIFCSPHIGHO2_12_FULL_35_23]|nr:MAG: hypothetical protein A3E87_03785 [Gammaproteobacteria bacterium RIFCSPHIGHO2_12_FULL_35_23]